MLAGFLAENQLPIPEAWPDGPASSSSADLRRQAARQCWSEACAHHWWRCYLDASDAEDAYAAWVLFVNAADRRSDIWRRREPLAAEPGDTLGRAKLAQARLSRSELKRRMNKRVEKLDKVLFGRTVTTGLGPWV